MEAIGYILLAGLVLYLVYLLVVYVILPGLAILLGVSLAAGGLIGLGYAVYNYFVALGRNIKPERI